ncbi:MAG: DUF2029 domain-containing protein [Candidatus Auribacter fodinae]|jgi:hypothetical protein|uniref:DUF2029 domain-containing protein n=1 Tax=Candidatus Auribacter fodinae TaxID=2093366 RepID=A0A3A4R3C3_9BACT|nr:MAG: DUF2029 domain-containing protein [Candidatus Auribacter fodinae]
MKRYFSLPVFLIPFVLTVLYGVSNLVLLSQQRAVFPLNKFFYMMDFRDYYAAGKLLFQHGKSPYDHDRYVTPPPAAVLSYPLGALPFKTARLVWAALILASTVFIILIVSVQAGSVKGDTMFIAGCLTVTFLFSYPYYFVFERGNIDWLVLVLCVAAMSAINARRWIGSGVLLGLAVCLKVYPAFLLIPFLITRRYKVLAGAIGTFAVSFLIQPRLWMEYITGRLLVRADFFRIDENASITTFYYHAARLLRLDIAQNTLRAVGRVSGLLMIAVLIIVLFRSRSSRSLAEQVMACIPFMFLLPHTVYVYGLIFYIPCLAVLFCNGMGRRMRLFLVSGLILAQAQCIILYKITNMELIHILPSFGNLVLAGVSIWYLGASRTGEANHAG